MIGRLILVAMLMFPGVACEKEIHEVRLDGVPQEKLTGIDIPATPDRL